MALVKLVHMEGVNDHRPKAVTTTSWPESSVPSSAHSLAQSCAGDCRWRSGKIWRLPCLKMGSPSAARFSSFRDSRDKKYQKGIKRGSVAPQRQGNWSVFALCFQRLSKRFKCLVSGARPRRNGFRRFSVSAKEKPEMTDGNNALASELN